MDRVSDTGTVSLLITSRALLIYHVSRNIMHTTNQYWSKST